MNKQILEFRKTDHFLYRQWDRGVSDSLIVSALGSINVEDSDKTILVIGNSTLKKNGEKVKPKSNLIIILKNNKLITLYYVTDLYDYLKSVSKRERDNNFILL